ncbi:MAG: PepSY domain-containing protein [Ardenticatenaceae bacterium]
MNINWRKLTRKTHYWGSIIIAVPVLIVIVTGLILQVKKQSTWVQPPTIKGQGDTPTILFDQILDVAKTVPEAEISSWDDVDRLDVRPGKGVVKIRANNRWEIQADLQTTEILQVAFRRSDWLESIHDGSFFHENAKLWLFLPSGIILLVLWLTGIYMFILPYQVKWKRRMKKQKAALKAGALSTK